MCHRELLKGEHLWNSRIGVPSMNVESDWCVVCSMPRPGYVDPAVKAEKWKAEGDAEEDEGLQRLLSERPRVTQLDGSGEAPPRPVSGTEMRDALAGGEEAA